MYNDPSKYAFLTQAQKAANTTGAVGNANVRLQDQKSNDTGLYQPSTQPITQPTTPIVQPPTASNTPIVSTDLAQTPSINFQTLPTPQPYDIYKLGSFSPMQATQQETQASELTKRLQGFNEQLAGQSQFRGEQEQQLGLPELTRTQKDLESRLTVLKNESLAIPLQLQQQAQGRGITAGGLKPIETGKLRENAIQALSVNSLLEASRGNLTLAQDMVDRAVAQKYDPIKEQIAINTANLDLILKDPATSLQDKNRAEQQKLINEQRTSAIAKQEEDEKSKRDFTIKLLSNNPNLDPVYVKALEATKSYEEAVRVANSLGLVEDPLARQKAQLDIQRGNAELRKTNAEIAKINQVATQTGSDPAELIAYAQQYASTGQIPTGMPKGTFGVISQYAKTMPKPEGSLVSSITGVKDNKVPAAEQDDITRLYNITKLADELKELDKERVAGVVGGSVNKVFGGIGEAFGIENSQAEYLTKRKAIIDEIARMQTGAALTKEEQAFYEDYLPGRFSQPLMLGQASGSKIDNFSNLMKQKLDNALANKQLQITGYSDRGIPAPDNSGDTVIIEE